MTRYLLLCVLALGAASGCLSPVVGTECADGRNACDGICVNLDDDPRNCGACGNDCGQLACFGGTCVGDDDLPDGGVIPIDPEDGGMGGDGGPSLPPCDLGERECGGVCVDPTSDPDDCGSCESSCGADEVCSSGTCESECLPPATSCGDVCVDTRNDPDHCGSCSTVCPSGICERGACEGPIAGHVVVIGHDYTQSRAGMRRLLGNAVFLGRSPDIDVVTYTGRARGAAVAGANAAIDQVGSELGRAWSAHPASAETVPLALASADVLLIYAQSDSDDATLARLGSDWRRALDSFVDAGGVIVVLEGGGANAGTFQLLLDAGLVGVLGRTVLGDDTLRVTDLTHAIATGVPTTYASEPTTSWFQTVESGIVVRDSRDHAVVIHRIVVPPGG